MCDGVPDGWVVLCHTICPRIMDIQIESYPNPHCHPPQAAPPPWRPCVKS